MKKEKSALSLQEFSKEFKEMLPPTPTIRIKSKGGSKSETTSPDMKGSFTPDSKESGIGTPSPISSLTHSGSNRSTPSQDSTKTDGSIADYLKYKLLRNINNHLGLPMAQNSINVQAIGEGNPLTQYEVVRNKIQEISDRDYNKIVEVGEVDSDSGIGKKSRTNYIRASLLCYKKEEVIKCEEGKRSSEGLFTEVKINVTTTDEEKEEILRFEVEVFTKALKERYDQLLLEIFALHEPAERAILRQECRFLSELVGQKSVFAKSINAALEGSLRGSDALRKILDDNVSSEDELRNKAEELLFKEVTDLFQLLEGSKVMTKIQTDNIDNEEKIPLLERLNKVAKEINNLKKKLQNRDEHDLLYSSLQGEYKTIETLLEDPDRLERIIAKKVRGHSEDYLYQYLNSEIGKNFIKSSIPDGSDRFYLMVSSTLDSCDRCAVKMEEIPKMIGEIIDMRSGMDCKVLYFATKEMSAHYYEDRRDYSGALGGLSSDSDNDDKVDVKRQFVVVNVQPSKSQEREDSKTPIGNAPEQIKKPSPNRVVASNNLLLGDDSKSALQSQGSLFEDKVDESNSNPPSLGNKARWSPFANKGFVKNGGEGALR